MSDKHVKEQFGPRRRTFRRIAKRQKVQVLSDAKKKILATAGSYNNNSSVGWGYAKTMVLST